MQVDFCCRKGSLCDVLKEYEIIFFQHTLPKNVWEKTSQNFPTFLFCSNCIFLSSILFLKKNHAYFYNSYYQKCPIVNIARKHHTLTNKSNSTAGAIQVESHFCRHISATISNFDLEDMGRGHRVRLSQWFHSMANVTVYKSRFRRNATHCISPYAIVVCVSVCVFVCRVCRPQENGLR